VAAILSSSSTKVMMNGCPKQGICYARRLRQGDPLSPMLFLLVMEVINALIRKADQWQPLRGLGVHSITHWTSLYVDDLILFVRPHAEDLQVMRHIFLIFEGASGLGCNLANYQLAPIWCAPEDIEVAMVFLPCQVIDFPLKYLSVPLSIRKKILRHALQPFVYKVADHLAFWKGQLNELQQSISLDQVYPIGYVHSPCNQLRVAALGSQGSGKNNERFPLVRHEFARWEMFSGMGQCSKATGAQGSRDPGAKDFLPSAPLAVVVASVRAPDQCWSALLCLEDRTTTTFFQASTQVVLGNGCRLHFLMDR
jgi:hypothetical protein